MHKKKELTPRQQKRIKIIALIIAGIVLSGLIAAIAIPMLSFAKEPEVFRAWVKENGVLSGITYVGMVVFQILAAFVPGEPFEIVAGYAFGSFWGTILCFVGGAIGSILVLLLVRKFGIKLIEVFFSKEKIESLNFLHSSKGKILVFSIIYTLPGTPKDLLCYFAGITDISLPLLIAICSFGRIPAIITSILGGDAFGKGDYKFTVIIFAVTVLVSGLGLLAYTLYQRKRKKIKAELPEDNEPTKKA